MAGFVRPGGARPQHTCYGLTSSRHFWHPEFTSARDGFDLPGHPTPLGCFRGCRTAPIPRRHFTGPRHLPLLVSSPPGLNFGFSSLRPSSSVGEEALGAHKSSRSGGPRGRRLARRRGRIGPTPAIWFERECVSLALLALRVGWGLPCMSTPCWPSGSAEALRSLRSLGPQPSGRSDIGPDRSSRYCSGSHIVLGRGRPTEIRLARRRA